MPTIVIRHPDGSTEEREVVGRLTVGTDEDNDLVLRAGGVCQRHAQFFADGGELVLENIGSAAATLVDGETLRQPRRLKQGVRVLIGEYEVSLKPNQVSVRRLAAVEPVASKTVEDDHGPRVARTPSGGGGHGLLLAGGGLLAVLAIGGGALLLMPAGQPTVVELDPPKPVDLCEQLEPQRRLARGEPSERALAAANEVLDCDPLSPEFLELKRQIERELKGADAAERATRMVDLGRDEQALEAFKEIPEGTKAFITSRPPALDAAARIRKESSKACLAYAREGKWVQAQPACEKAMEIACQGMSADELHKPADPVLVSLLKARGVNDPSGPKWRCAPLALIKPAKAVEDPAKAMKAAIARRIEDPQMAGAVLLYAQGKVAEAIVQLQVVKEKSSKAAVHGRAEELRKDMANIDSLKKIGDGMLQKNELEKAAKIYREALDLDAQLIPEPESTPSVTRRSILTEVAQASVRLGIPLARRPDLPKACAVLRIGFSFTRGNLELNDALTRECSTNARKLLDTARTCADLDRALALAIPNDGIAEAIAAQRPQLGCR